MIDIFRKIAFDLDDTLWSFNSVFLKWHDRVYGTEHNIQGIDSYDMTQWLQVGKNRNGDGRYCDLPAVINRVQSFVESSSHLTIPLENQAKEVLESLARDGGEIWGITSRSQAVESQTRGLLTHLGIANYFGKDFQRFIVTGGFDKKHKARGKADYCKEKDIGIIIEDNFDTALSCARGGIYSILLKKPWNIRPTQEYLDDKIKKTKLEIRRLRFAEDLKEAHEIIQEIIN